MLAKSGDIVIYLFIAGLGYRGTAQV